MIDCNALPHLEAYLKAHQLPCDSQRLAQFAQYRDLVLSWNEKINLTAITDPGAFEKLHYIDSMAAALHPAFAQADQIIDMGTGGGFPGVPLAILYPEKRFVLADSLAKRLKVIDEMISAIGLTNCETVHGRAEDLGRNPLYRERFAVCVSRAVANLPVLAEYCLPLVRVGGTFLAYKGPEGEGELTAATRAIALLGGGNGIPLEAGNTTDNHILIAISKEKSTPKTYPRKAGTPSKQPL